MSSWIGKRHRVVITGGAGFIGSHLCDALLAAGIKVCVVDDLRSGRLSNLPVDSPNLEFEQLTVGDAGSVARLEKCVRAASFVFHLASPVGVSLTHREPGGTASSIVLGGAQIVQLCAAHRRPVAFTSSSEVYGQGSDSPIREDASLVLSAAPRFSYAAAKLAVEHMVLDLSRRGVVHGWVVRLFNIAGPRQRSDAGVVAGFARALVHDEEQLRIEGDGRQTRCFLHVEDAVNALLAVADCPQLAGRPVNIGSEKQISIRELASVMQLAHGSNVPCRYTDYRGRYGDDFVPVQTRRPNTGLLRESTSWKSGRELTDIVSDTLQYARGELDRSGCHGIPV